MTKISKRIFLKKLGMGIGASLAFPTISLSTVKDINIYDGKKLNIAICGLGNYANILRQGLVQSNFCQLAGIITGTPAKAEKWKKDFNIPQENIYDYERFDQLAYNTNIDLVYTTLPNSMHKEFTIRAAKAGKHVIVEKPMAFTEKDCKEMIETCNNAGVQLAVGYRLQYEPHHIELKKLGQEKVFGQVRLIEASLGYRISNINPSDWHLKKAMAGGGPLMNLGVYCIQSCRYVLGEEPISVTAQFGPVTMPHLNSEVEESITWQMVFPSGAISTSTTTNNSHVDRFYASADNGFFELNPALSYGPFEGRTKLGKFNFPIINQQAAMLDGIGKKILEKKPVPIYISGEEGRRDMKIIEGIYEAAITGKRISLI